jgi:hypothetical protein
MKSYELPEGYQYRFAVDLRQDRTAVLVVGIGQMVTILIMGFLGLAVLPNAILTRSMLWIQIACLCLGILCFMLLHEVIRGLLMGGLSGCKTRCRLIGWRVYSLNDAYFTKGQYVFVLLFPVVLLIGINAVLLGASSEAWKWALYALLILNIAGLWEDGYLAVSVLRLPSSSRFQHTGAGVEIFEKKIEENENYPQ